MYGSYGNGWMFGGGGMLLGSLWMILLWGVPLLLLFALLKYLFSKSSDNGTREGKQEKNTPLDILKSAYARGEISREEFLQKRDDLLEK